ncbi:MAG: hypothetical protein ABI348_03760 [Nitrososphaera sp.]|jgi:hypothetical protein
MSTKNFLSKKVIVVSILAVVAVSAIFVASSMVAQATAQQQAMMWMRGAGGGMTTTMPAIKGSVSVANETAGFIHENVKVPFAAAAKTAQEQVANETMLGGHLGVVQGYLVYTFFAADTSSQTGHLIIVDAGNGQLLYTSEGHPLGSFGSAAGHWGGPWHGGWWGGPWKGQGFGWGMWH